MIALAVSALFTAYLLIPNAIFRFLLGRFVPLRLFQDKKTEDLTRAVVTLVVLYGLTFLIVWYIPVCRSHPFSFTGSASLRVSDYETVTAGLYSEADFRANKAKFWDAFGRTLERQGRFLCWYYILVSAAAILSGLAIRHYGRLRRHKIYVWIADFYLLPHISQWYALLTPFTFEDKRTVVKADVLMTDNTLYRGDVAEYFVDKDGNLSGLFLANPSRFDRRAHLREQDAWSSARKSLNFWVPIPSAKLYLFADKIVNLNLNYEPPLATVDVLTKYLNELQARYGKTKAGVGIKVSIVQPSEDNG